MFASAVFAFPLVIASFCTLTRAAAPYPTEPADGPKVYNAKSSCRFKWSKGDSSWASFNLELMTGSNVAMKSLQTVATGLQGANDGTFEFPCPTVDINAPIYFYRLTSAKASAPNYSTRFTIASESGKTVSAPNAIQPPPDNTAVGWGIGSIVSGGSTSSSSSSSGSKTATSSAGSASITTSSSSSGSVKTTTTTTATTTSTGTTTFTTVWTMTKSLGGQTTVQTKTATVTAKFTSIQTPSPSATVTTTTTIWIKPATATVVSQLTKMITQTVQNTVTVVQTQTQGSSTVTVNNVSTSVSTSSATSTSGSGNRGDVKNGANGSFNVPVMHLLAVIAGSIATCLTLLS